MPEKKPYLKLFLSTLTISAFTFGGGYVIVPLLKKRFTDTLGWITEEEMLELVAIGQSGPGAIALNTSTLIGYRVAGFPGAVLALSGTVIPPLVILSVVSVFYEFIRDNRYVAAAMHGMQAGIAAVICDVVLGMAKPFFKQRQTFSIVVMLLAFILVWFFNINVAFVVIGAGILGGVMVFISRKREGGEGL